MNKINFSLKKHIGSLLSVCILSAMMLYFPSLGLKAEAADDYAQYAEVLFDTDKGLSSQEVNCIFQTDAGYILVGTYAGLYEYDGNTFSKMDIPTKISNVMTLESGRDGEIWIGTNDAGLISYNEKTGETKVYNEASGLDSESIKDLFLAENGDLYIGTAEALYVLKTDDSLQAFPTQDGLSFVRCIDQGADGEVLVCTNGGDLYFVNSSMEMRKVLRPADMTEHVTHVLYLGDDQFLLGTMGRKLFLLNQKTGKLDTFLSDMAGGDVTCLARLADNTIFVGGEQGLGYLDDAMEYVPVQLNTMHTSVVQVVEDVQGNLWIASNKQGVVKLSQNPFANILASLTEDHAVNSVCSYNNQLYIGCDDGLIILNSKNTQVISNRLTDYFEGVRIRQIYKDSNNRLWFSTYGAAGLVCVENGKMISYTEGDGTQGTRFRSILELQDGTIVAASSTGLTFLKDGVVVGTLGENDGLAVPQILSMVEAEDGTVYCGSDGDGVYLVKDGALVGHIGGEEGLETGVILRIVPYQDGFLYVTSNSIYCDEKGKIRRLENFPYSNNYDVYISKDGMAWVSSSAGLFVCKLSDMLQDSMGYPCELLNKSRGLDTTLTANAWNYVNQAETIYFCCSDGVRSISLSEYGANTQDIPIHIQGVSAHGQNIVPDENGVYMLDKDSYRVIIQANVLNYSLSNPMIYYYLEGFENSGVTTSQKELGEISYTNLSHGTYRFHFQLVDRENKAVISEQVITIVKKDYIYKYSIFWLGVFFAFFVVILILLLQLINNRHLLVVNKQYEEIKKAKEEAEQANRYKSRFLSNMSHEIRTPINTIMGMDELILREDTSPLVHQYAGDIYSAGNSLLEIVNDLLDLSRIEYGSMHLEEKEYETKDALLSLCNSLIIRCKEKNLACSFVFDEDIPSKMVGDANRLNQVIMNLMSNAIKYTKEGQITFSITVDHRDGEKIFLRFSVKDTGIGIKEEDMGKLFQNLGRLESEKSSGVRGAGIGLSISNQLLGLMDSSLQVESEYEKGSDFFFVVSQTIVGTEMIGAYDPSKRDVKKVEMYHASFTVEDTSILVVDDTPLNLAVVRGLLRGTKASVDTVSGGMEALDMITHKHYDLIFLDHMMPEMDGLETLQKMNEIDHLCKETPVVVLTANAVAGARDEYIAKGFSDYLSKPVAGPELEKMLEKYLPKKKLVYPDAAEEQRYTIDRKYMSLSHLLPKNGIRNCANDPAMYDVVLRLFVDEYQETYQSITNACKNRDLDVYRRSVTRLRESATTIGAEELTRRTIEMLTYGQEKNWVQIVKKEEEFLGLYLDIVEEIRGQVLNVSEEK